MIKTIGVLTSGGDAPGMNAAVRAVTRAGIAQGLEVKVIYRGYKGLIDGEVKTFTTQDVSGIIPRGGTIIKSARCLEFKEPEGRKQAYETLQREHIDALIVIGGDGTFTGGRAFAQEYDVPVIGIPGTIDNDLWGTDMTFGFQSAVDVATQVIDNIHTTADSHGRVFIIEVMGHKVGWLTLNAGMAGGADVILIPEIPYDIDKICEAIEARDKRGSRFTIIAVAEGAISKKDAKLSKKEYKEKMANYKYPSVSYEIAEAIQNKTGHEVRVTVPGHMQRGGAPDPYDRVFASRLGAEAGKLILKKEYGFMVAYKNREIVKVPLGEIAGKLKYVSPDASIIKEAKMLGVCFGD